MTEFATPGQVAASVVMLTLFAASPVMAVWLVVRRVHGNTPVSFTSRAAPKFGLLELVLTAVAYIGFNVLAYGVLQAAGVPMGRIDQLSADHFLLMVFANSLAAAAACGLLFLMLPLRRGARWADLGLTFQHAPTDVALGAGAFLLMAGFVYLLQSILFQLFPQAHPLLEMIKSNPQPKYFLGAFFSAAIMAPIYEEIFFRGAVQGWLEKFFIDDRPGRDSAPEAAVLEAEVIDAEPADPPPATAARGDNPFASPMARGQAEAAEAQRTAMAATTQWWPIVISSLLFAAMHLGQGPAPIPLFFLALCLGYMYQKTHRLLPCITLHALLNATSITMLWLSLGTGSGN